MKASVSIQISGFVDEIIVAEFERNGPVTGAVLGLTLDEAKGLLRKIQSELVCAQIRTHLKTFRKCATCGKRRPLKEYRPGCFKSLFSVFCSTLWGVAVSRSPFRAWKDAVVLDRHQTRRH